MSEIVVIGFQVIVDLSLFLVMLAPHQAGNPLHSIHQLGDCGHISVSKHISVWSVKKNEKNDMYLYMCIASMW